MLPFREFFTRRSFALLYQALNHHKIDMLLIISWLLVIIGCVSSLDLSGKTRNADYQGMVSGNRSPSATTISLSSSETSSREATSAPQAASVAPVATSVLASEMTTVTLPWVWATNEATMSHEPFTVLRFSVSPPEMTTSTAFEESSEWSSRQTSAQNPLKLAIGSAGAGNSSVASQAAVSVMSQVTSTTTELTTIHTGGAFSEASGSRSKVYLTTTMTTTVHPSDAGNGASSPNSKVYLTTTTTITVDPSEESAQASSAKSTVYQTTTITTTVPPPETSPADGMNTTETTTMTTTVPPSGVSTPVNNGAINTDSIPHRVVPTASPSTEPDACSDPDTSDTPSPGAEQNVGTPTGCRTFTSDLSNLWGSKRSKSKTPSTETLRTKLSFTTAAEKGPKTSAQVLSDTAGSDAGTTTSTYRPTQKIMPTDTTVSAAASSLLFHSLGQGSLSTFSDFWGYHQSSPAPSPSTTKPTPVDEALHTTSTVSIVSTITVGHTSTMTAMSCTEYEKQNHNKRSAPTSPANPFETESFTTVIRLRQKRVIPDGHGHASFHRKFSRLPGTKTVTAEAPKSCVVMVTLPTCDREVIEHIGLAITPEETSTKPEVTTIHVPVEIDDDDGAYLRASLNLEGLDRVVQELAKRKGGFGKAGGAAGAAASQGGERTSAGARAVHAGVATAAILVLQMV